jgi:hypothetical protein
MIVLIKGLWAFAVTAVFACAIDAFELGMRAILVPVFSEFLREYGRVSHWERVTHCSMVFCYIRVVHSVILAGSNRITTHL